MGLGWGDGRGAICTLLYGSAVYAQPVGTRPLLQARGRTPVRLHRRAADTSTAVFVGTGDTSAASCRLYPFVRNMGDLTHKA